MPRTATLTPATADVLRAATVTADSVTLNSGQLDPKVYKEVNQALSRIGGGGKWNRKQGAHLFPRDPRAELAALLDDGRMPVDQAKALSFFRTPDGVADLLACDLADLHPGARVLEPSAGDGALVAAMRRVSPDASIVAVECDEHRAAGLRERFADDRLVTVVHGRLQDWAAGMEDGEFDGVLANPPFTEPGDARAWVEHLHTAWRLLAAGGTLAAILPNSVGTGSDRRTAAARDLIRAHGGWVDLDPEAFKTSGTLVRTVHVTMTRPDVEDPDGEGFTGLTTDGIGVDFSSSKRLPTAANTHPEEHPVSITDDRPTTTDAQRDDFDRILHLAPETLVIGMNVRLDPRLDRAFVDSVKARGVSEVVTAYYGPDGSLTVLKGQRRTLAAVQAGRPTIPVRIVAAPSADSDRILDQLAENERRTAMGLGETALAYEQLALGGMSAAAIARQTGTKKEAVYQRLTVARSELARRAGDRYALDLVQAATVAEFEDDAETVKALVAAAKTGQFEHVAQRARDARTAAAAEQAAREARVTLAAELAAAGVAVVDPPAPGDTEVYLSDLSLTPDQVAAHVECEGHAVALLDHLDDDGTTTWQAAPVCVDPTANGHAVPAKPRKVSTSTAAPTAATPSGERASGPMSDEEKAARALLIARNKAWTSASTVRREWIASLSQRKTVPAGAELFIFEQLVALRPWMRRAVDTKHGLYEELTGGARPTTPKRSTVLTLALILAAWDDQVTRGDWRAADDSDRAVFAALTGWGYNLSDVERLAVEGEPVEGQPDTDAAAPVVEASDAPDYDEAAQQEAERTAVEESNGSTIAGVTADGTLVVIAQTEHVDMTAPVEVANPGELVEDDAQDVDDDGLTEEERQILAADIAAQSTAGEESQEVTAGE